MTENRRFKLIKECKDKAEIEGLNMLTLYCLIATMTDRKLTEFHKEYMNQELKPKKK